MPAGCNCRLHCDRRHRIFYRGGLWRNRLSHQRTYITDAAQAAAALVPFAGKFAAILFAVGLVNASLLSAAILPLATSYNICEGLGFESGIDKRFSEAPIFYWLYTLLILGGAAFVLIPGFALVEIYSFLAGSQRSAASLCVGLHVASGKPAKIDGYFQKQTLAKRGGLGYGRHDDFANYSPGL